MLRDLLELKKQTKQTKKKTQPTTDSQVHNVIKEPVQTQNAISVEMLTSELFRSKMETSWAFGSSAAALQFCFSI